MRQFIIFRLGLDWFGIDILKVSEVLRSFVLKPVPDLPPYVPGVMTLRSAVIPVVDLRIRFCLQSLTRRERTILVKTTVGTVGLLVDEIRGIVKLKDSDISNPPMVYRGLKSSYLAGIVKHNADVVMLLDVDNVLTSEEMLMLLDLDVTDEGQADMDGHAA